jgi:hypothetical protein
MTGQELCERMGHPPQLPSLRCLCGAKTHEAARMRCTVRDLLDFSMVARLVPESWLRRS